MYKHNLPPEVLNMKLPLSALFSPSMLYEMTLHPDFESSPDKQEIVETLARLERIRPEDINSKFDWGSL